MQTLRRWDVRALGEGLRTLQGLLPFRSVDWSHFVLFYAAPRIHLPPRGELEDLD